MARDRVTKLHSTAHAYDRAAQIRVSFASFDEVLMRHHILKPNQPDRGGSHVLIGRNRQATCLAIPVNAADHQGEWHAITVWRCDAAEETTLGK